MTSDQTIIVGRGQKLCKSCNTINGVRSFNCKKCGQSFTMKKPAKNRPGKNRERITDHKTLKRGDKIGVIGGSGPYYRDKDGIRHHLTNRGKYTVHSVDDNGIHAYDGTGYNYIYMGKRCRSSALDTIFKRPHKIVLLSRA